MDFENLQGDTLIIARAADFRALADRIIEQLKAQAPQVPSVSSDDTLFSFAETCKFLGISRPTGTRWRNAGKISGHLMGGKLYFFKSELINALKNGL